MKANELMIGDWVKFPAGNDKIQEISYQDEAGCYYVWFAASATLFPCNIKDIEPIPLTAEILEKNFHGYKRGSGALTHFIYELNEDFFIHASAGSIDLCDLCIHYDDSEHAAHDDIYLVELRYAHELQHALRLFGIEKEIEL